MTYNTPNINYKSIMIAGKDISLSSTHKISLKDPYNKIQILMNPTNCSLSYYEVRVTKDTDDYDIGVGSLAYWDTNIPINHDYSFTINVTTDIFNKGDGTYRLSLYARSSIDNSWDVTYLFFTVGGEKFEPINSEGFEVLTIVDAPENE